MTIYTTIYTIEIAGRPTVAFSAENLLAAEGVQKAGGGIEEVLSCLDDAGGKPLWDGEAELFLREAHEEEREEWDKVVAHAVQEGDPASRQEAEEDGYVIFLVPVSDPDDDDAS